MVILVNFSGVWCDLYYYEHPTSSLLIEISLTAGKAKRGYKSLSSLLLYRESDYCIGYVCCGLGLGLGSEIGCERALVTAR